MTLPFIGEKLNGTSNTFFGYIFGAENSYNSAYSVPSSLKEVVVTTATVLGDSAFNNCKYITDVTIPKSVKKIDYGAFLECPDLTDIWYTGSESDREQISVFSYVGFKMLLIKRILQNNLFYLFGTVHKQACTSKQERNLWNYRQNQTNNS